MAEGDCAGISALVEASQFLQQQQQQQQQQSLQQEEQEEKHQEQETEEGGQEAPVAQGVSPGSLQSPRTDKDELSGFEASPSIDSREAGSGSGDDDSGVPVTVCGHRNRDGRACMRRGYCPYHDTVGQVDMRVRLLSPLCGATNKYGRPCKRRGYCPHHGTIDADGVGKFSGSHAPPPVTALSSRIDARPKKHRRKHRQKKKHSKKQKHRHPQPQGSDPAFREESPNTSTVPPQAGGPALPGGSDTWPAAGQPAVAVAPAFFDMASVAAAQRSVLGGMLMQMPATLAGQQQKELLAQQGQLLQQHQLRQVEQQVQQQYQLQYLAMMQKMHTQQLFQQGGVQQQYQRGQQVVQPQDDQQQQVGQQLQLLLLQQQLQLQQAQDQQQQQGQPQQQQQQQQQQ